MIYPAERLVYWYFRLNGFLTTENFIVHPDRGREQQTDADLLAVRMVHRAENLVFQMEDDPRVAACSSFCNVIIAEVKTGRCALNGPWTDPGRMNMERVLRAIGCVEGQHLSQAATCLYENGSWQNESVSVRLFAIGQTKSELVIPGEQQLTWGEIIKFFVQRFRDYKPQKSSVGQWTADGKKLQRLALKSDAEAIRALFLLPKGDAAYD